MNYAITTNIKTTIADAEALVREALKSEGFGVLTEIDLQGTLKAKINADIHPYKILGACNPPLAHRAITAEDKIGLMLPCNVILQQKGDVVEVSAIDPVASMQAVSNDALKTVAGEVREKLTRVINGLKV